MRRPLLVLSCVLHVACFAPDGSVPEGHASTGIGEESSSDGTPMAPATSSTPSSTLTATHTSTDGTTLGDDETSTGDPASSESSAASTTAQESEGGGSDSTTGTLDPCQLALESFTEDPGWTSHALPDGGNDYGWSGVTDNAGGAIGEIGGTFQRSATESFYADAVGPLDATQCIAASGTLVVTRKDVDFNQGVRVGHFSVDADAFVGFAVMEDVVGVRIFVGAGGVYELAFEVPDPEIPRAWSYAYDPAAATMTLDLEGFGSVTHDLTVEQLDPIADIDAFGFRNASHPQPEVAPGLLELWIDDANYTR